MKPYLLIGAIASAAIIASLIATTPLARAAPSWAVVEAASAKVQDANLSKLTIDASGNIPRKTDVSPDAVAGFAFADLDTGKVLVATIHPTFRDSAQNPDSWHLHAAQLASGTGGHNFCIDSFFPNPQGGISIMGDIMSINIENAQMPFATTDIDGAVGFVVNGEPGCATGLAVDLTAAPVGLS